MYIFSFTEKEAYVCKIGITLKKKMNFIQQKNPIKS